MRIGQKIKSITGIWKLKNKVGITIMEIISKRNQIHFEEFKNKLRLIQMNKCNKNKNWSSIKSKEKYFYQISRVIWILNHQYKSKPAQKTLVFKGMYRIRRVIFLDSILMNKTILKADLRLKHFRAY